jgi:hypothetical protein
VFPTLSCARGLVVSHGGVSLSLLEATVLSYPQYLDV